MPNLGQIDAAPAKQPGVDGPCAWSDHRQDRAEDRLSDRNPWVAGMRKVTREGDPDFHDGCQRSRHQGPETDQKEYPGSNSNHLQNNGRRGR